MTLEERIGEAEDGYDILNLDPDFEGSCPCFWVRDGDAYMHGHCWRTCQECEYVGLHVHGISNAAAEAAARHP